MTSTAIDFEGLRVCEAIDDRADRAERGSVARRDDEAYPSIRRGGATQRTPVFGRNATEEIDSQTLSTAEKILQLQDLWDRIAQNPDAVEVTEAQKQEIDLRLAANERDPEAGTPWDEVKAALRKRD